MIAQREALLSAIAIAPIALSVVDFPLQATWIRVGSRKQDDDNLRGAFKALRDALAELLGVDDGDQRVAWGYDQEAGAAGVRLVVSNSRP